jgi:hypothetical protein
MAAAVARIVAASAARASTGGVSDTSTAGACIPRITGAAAVSCDDNPTQFIRGDSIKVLKYSFVRGFRQGGSYLTRY